MPTDALNTNPIDSKITTPSAVDRWIKLVMTQRSKERAEIRVLVEIKPTSSVANPTLTESANQDKAPKTRRKEKNVEPSLKSLSALKSQKMEQIQNSLEQLDNAYYQIQPHTAQDKNFKVAIVIAFSDNLNTLQNISPSGNEPYYFFFSILDMDFQTNAFSNLEEPSFPAAINTFRIRSHPKMLSQFFKAQSPLDIYLCKGDSVLACTKVPLVTDNVDGQLKTSEAVYELKSVDGEAFSVGPPLIGVLISVEEELDKTKKGTSQNQNATDVELDSSIDKNPEDTVLHFYKLGIDIHGIKLEEYPNGSIYGYFRYNYPAFGPSAFHTVRPAVIISKADDAHFENGYCGFEVFMERSNLKDLFTKYPLNLELWEDGGGSSDTLIATSKIPLSNFVASLGHHNHTMCEDTKLLTNETKGFKSLIQYTLTLDDMGTVKPEEVARKQSRQEILNNRPRKTQTNTTEAPPHVGNDVRQSEEYKFAYELEMWKKKEQRNFLCTLSEKERQLLQGFATEWNTRRKLFTDQLNAKVEDLTKLETSLLKLATDLELRENALKDAEVANIRYRQDLERTHDKSIAEARDAMNRFQDELNFKYESLKNKNYDLQNTKEDLSLQKKALEERYRNLSQEYEEFRRRSQPNVPKSIGNEEFVVLQRKNLDLEKMVKKLNESAKNYKSRWIQALEEISRLRKEKQDELENRILKEQQEIERLRQHYLEREAKGPQASNIHNEENVRKAYEKGDAGHEAVRIEQVEEKDEGQEFLLQEIQRLTNERTCLLSTGVYFGDDDIVKDITRRINQLKVQQQPISL
jgi:centrosomal protein CEP120